MKLSARNQIKGIVSKVEDGAVNGIVHLKFDGGVITGTITMNAIHELGLKKDVPATAIIKATEVMVGLGDMKLSARNKLKGVITRIDIGAVNAVVEIETAGSHKITADITINAVKELGLQVGMEAVAVIKATSVMFAAD